MFIIPYFYVSVLPSSAIQINNQGEMHNMPTITMSNATSASGTILQYASQDGQFFVPGKFFFKTIISRSLLLKICCFKF